MSKSAYETVLISPKRFSGIAVACLVLAVAFSGCAKKVKETDKAKAEASAAPSVSPAEKRAEEQKAVEELSLTLETQEDFEEAAENEITDETSEAELTKLEAEIQADPDTLLPAALSATPAATSK